MKIKLIIIITLSFWFGIAGAESCFSAEKTDQENFATCQTTANLGDADSQFAVALMYDIGIGITQDYRKSVKWYTLAAEQGYAYAQFSLGLAYNNGTGAIQDYREAAKWYEMAAKNGVASAMNNLAILFGAAQGVEEDVRMAHMFFNLSVYFGNEDAREGLAILESLMSSTDVSEAQAMARKWLAEYEKRKELGVDDNPLNEQSILDSILGKATEVTKPNSLDTDKSAAMAYFQLIERQIMMNWSRPPSTRNSMFVGMEIHLLPNGELKDVFITVSSGDLATDLSAERAVRKVSRYEVPEDTKLFELYFRRFEIGFRPEDLNN